MWVNIDIEGLTKEEILEVLQNLWNEFGMPIKLSFNCNRPNVVLLQILNEVMDMCSLLGIPVSVGPQFAEDGIYYQGKLSFMADLYFYARSQKILWWLEHSKEQCETNVVLVASNMGIEPLIVNFREKKHPLGCRYYFLYNTLENNIGGLITQGNIELRRNRN